MQENAKAVRDSQGAVLYYDGTVEDVTERKRIVDALRTSEERFRQVAEDAGVFVWEVDADGLYTYASPVVETILGYAPDELIGKLHYYDLFAPDDREELKAIATEAFAQRRSFSALPECKCEERRDDRDPGNQRYAVVGRGGEFGGLPWH